MGSGGGGGLTIPGMEVWTFASNGGPASATITTTDAVPVFVTWASLPAAGAAINFYAIFTGQQSTGERSLFRHTQAGYARAAAGENSIAPVAAVVTSGYEDPGGVPWNTLVANPVGWGGGVNFLPGGNIIQVAFNGAAGQTIDWKVVIFAIPYFGAVILT